jgi:hypothetical protein
MYRVLAILAVCFAVSACDQPGEPKQSLYKIENKDMTVKLPHITTKSPFCGNWYLTPVPKQVSPTGMMYAMDGAGNNTAMIMVYENQVPQFNSRQTFLAAVTLGMNGEGGGGEKNSITLDRRFGEYTVKLHRRYDDPRQTESKVKIEDRGYVFLHPEHRQTMITILYSTRFSEHEPCNMPSNWEPFLKNVQL